MFFEPIIEITVVLVAVVVWQQWRIKTLEHDMDVMYDRHNQFVGTMIELLNGAEAKVEVYVDD
jgi:hypothetical protein